MDDSQKKTDPACAICGRRLLPGERLNPYLTPDSEEVTVCELCKPRAEAGGWLRPDEVAGRGGSGGPRRRRGRGQLLAGLRERMERPGVEPESERSGGEGGRPGRRRRRPGQPDAGGSRRDEREPASGRGSGESPRRGSGGAAGPDVAEALAAFNASEQRRTVSGLSRSLGEPVASIHAVRTASGANGARLTVAWELAWYQWEIGPGRRGPELRQMAKGETLDQLSAADRNWNLLVGDDGSLSRRSRAENPE